MIKNALLTHLKLFLIGSQIVLSFINLCTNYSVILSNCLFWCTQRNLCARCLILCYHGNHVWDSGHSSTQVHTCFFAEALIKASFFSMCTTITFIALQAIRWAKSHTYVINVIGSEYTFLAAGVSQWTETTCKKAITNQLVTGVLLSHRLVMQLWSFTLSCCHGS